MWELVKAGGWLMLPLVLCSIFMVAISIERFIRLKKTAVIPSEILMGSHQNASQVIQKVKDSKQLSGTALGQVFLAGANSQEKSADYARAQMEVTASQEIGYLEKNINFLGTISAVAPLLGLLGTVIGIIEAFLVIDIGAAGDAVMMMPGISKALITTAAGMLIAVPALFAHRYFQRLVHEYVATLEQQATLFHADLYYHQASATSEDIQKAS